MRKPSTSELLRRAPLFAAMPAAAVDGLAARAARKRLRPKQCVPAETVVVVLTGRIDIVAEGVVVRSLVPPAVAGVSVAVGARPSAELRVAEAAELVFVPLDVVVGRSPSRTPRSPRKLAERGRTCRARWRGSSVREHCDGGVAGSSSRGGLRFEALSRDLPQK